MSNEPEDSKPTAGFQRVIQRSVIRIQEMGRDNVGGVEVLWGIFAERGSHAQYFLQEQKIKKLDVEQYILSKNLDKEQEATPVPTQHLRAVPTAAQIEKSIARSAESAPEFRAYRGRIRYRQSPADGRIAERKAAAQERCVELQRRCASRANEQTELAKLADRYASTLKRLRRDRGAYKLFLVGLELELLLKTKANANPDPDRNPPLDADLLFTASSLIVAHAGLISIFPDAKRVTQELDRYRQLTESIDAFNDRILDPVFEQLARPLEIFDEDTQELTREIKALADLENAQGQSPSQGTTAVKHGWLRGVLGSLGQYLLRQVKESTKAVRDAAIQVGVAEFLKNPTRLAAAIFRFLSDARESLAVLANKLPTGFGWINSLLSLLGLK